MKRDCYIRLFSDPETEGFAVRLLHDGFSYTFIGRILNCDRSSVYSLQKRKEADGMVFKNYEKSLDKIYKLNYRKINREKRRRARLEKLPKPSTMKFFKPEEGTTYAEYRAIDQEKTREIREERMEIARETIRKVHLQRDAEEAEKKRYREKLKLKKHG
jgi:predicted transcriptional regulator